MLQKNLKMTETLAYGYPSESTWGELMNTNMIGFRWFLKIFVSLFLERK